MGKMRNVYKITVGMPEGKRPHGKSTCRSEDNIRMDFTEIGWRGMNWIQLVQVRDQYRDLMNTVNLWDPYKARSFLD
jgi:hypothetical protein